MLHHFSLFSPPSLNPYLSPPSLPTLSLLLPYLKSTAGHQRMPVSVMSTLSMSSCKSTSNSLMLSSPYPSRESSSPHSLIPHNPYPVSPPSPLTPHPSPLTLPLGTFPLSSSLSLMFAQQIFSNYNYWSSLHHCGYMYTHFLTITEYNYNNYMYS